MATDNVMTFAGTSCSGQGLTKTRGRRWQDMFFPEGARRREADEDENLSRS